MDFEVITNGLLRYLDQLTEEQQAQAVESIGLVIGKAVMDTKTKIDDTLVANVVLPNINLLANSIDDAMTNVDVG